MKHTQGKVIINNDVPSRLSVSTEEEYINRIYICGLYGDGKTEEVKANAQLIAEAFNVTNETGKSPEQLAQENKALAELNKELVEALKFFAMLNPLHYKDIAGGILKTVELLTKAERINK